MARMQLITFAAIGLMAVGCVSQEKYNALKMDRDRQAEQLGQAQNEASAARSEADAYKNQLGAIGNATGSKDGMILNLTNQNADLQRQIDELNHKYTDAINKVGTASPLPAELNDELSQFARQNPDLVDFDSARGIVKFKSDVTFDSGSTVVKPNAIRAIARFAEILNSPAASGYELMVAGHTDNTNVMNPATVRAGNKDNWYLSAHRAIAVADVLMADRVSSQRLSVTGYADQRPIASNSTDAGRAENRRVEVLILPTQVRNSYASSPTHVGTVHRTAARPELNKDSAVPSAAHLPMNKDSVAPAPAAPRQPVFNK